MTTLHHILQVIFLIIVTTKDPHYFRHYCAWIEGEVFHALSMYRVVR